MGGARPETHRVNLQPALVLQAEPWTPQSRYLWSCWSPSGQHQLKEPLLQLALDPERSGGEEGGSQASCDHKLLSQLAFTLHKGSVLWEKMRMVLVAILTPFCCCASCQTLQSTHRQMRVHLSVNKGCLFKVRMNSEF